MHWRRLRVCLHMQTRSSCCVPPVAPSGLLWLQTVPLGSQELGLWSGGSGLPPERISVLFKLLLTLVKETTNCLIAPFSVFHFLLHPAGLGLGSAVFQTRPQQQNSNICNTKLLNCANTPLALNRALFFSYVLQRHCND